MSIKKEKLFEAFILLNKTSSLAPGESSRYLAHRTAFYKKKIKDLFEIEPDEIFPHLVDTHASLSQVECSSEKHSHMLHDSIFFLERLISKSIKDHIQDKKESLDIDSQTKELDNLISTN